MLLMIGFIHEIYQDVIQKHYQKDIQVLTNNFMYVWLKDCQCID
jgi:hypothetical protein